MSVTRRHTVYDVQLGKVSPVRLPGITSASLRTEAEVRAEETSGALYPEHAAVVAINPAGQFESVSLDDCLTEIGFGGISIADLPTGFDMFGYKHLEGSGRATGTAHRKFSMTEGIIIPTRISAEHQGDASITYDVLPTWDTTNDPFVEADTQSVPAAANDNARFAIGKVTLGGTVYNHVRSVEIDFGANVERAGADSDLYPTHASIIAQRPTITLTGIDLEWLKAANIPRHGAALAHASTSVYFRKRTVDADGYVADATAEHVKVTAAGVAVVDDVFQSQGDGPLQTSIRIACTYDGSNAPLVISPASAIT